MSYDDVLEVPLDYLKLLDAYAASRPLL